MILNCLNHNEMILNCLNHNEMILNCLNHNEIKGVLEKLAVMKENLKVTDQQLKSEKMNCAISAIVTRFEHRVIHFTAL